MAHMIDMTNNRENMAYIGRRPWHGLGQELEEGQPLEVWAQQAGLDWEAHEAPVQFETPFGMETIADRKVVYRSDNKFPLGVVSDRYSIVQPREALDFFEEYLSAGDMSMETAGALDDGRRIWALARVGDDLVVKGQDRIEGFLLLATSFDGSMATTAKFTTVRVVCQNTLHMADAQGNTPTFRIPHSTKFDAEKARVQLGLKEKAWAEFGDLVTALADRKVDKFEARNWLIEVFGDPAKPLDEQDDWSARQMKKAWEAVEGGVGQNLASTAGTAWGLLNGVTYLEDHGRNYRSDNGRLSNGWFGEGASTKSRALKAALKLVA